jgi:hypothetical protein
MNNTSYGVGGVNRQRGSVPPRRMESPQPGIQRHRDKAHGTEKAVAAAVCDRIPERRRSPCVSGLHHREIVGEEVNPQPPAQREDADGCDTQRQQNCVARVPRRVRRIGRLLRQKQEGDRYSEKSLRIDRVVTEIRPAPKGPNSIRAATIVAMTAARVISAIRIDFNVL